MNEEGASRDPVGVVVVDDHPVVREGLAALLAWRGARVVGSAASSQEAFAVIRETSPQVVIVDLLLPDDSGLDLTERIVAEHPAVKVVIYTAAEEAATLAEALDSGAHGFVLKGGSMQELSDGIAAVCAGERYVDPRILEVMDRPDGRGSVLSPREREVFDLLAEGLRGSDIARRLGLSPATVRTHVRNAMAKLDAHTRTEAVVRAIERGEISG